MDNQDEGPNIAILKFADSKIPTFIETRGKDYIKYGKENDYPEYLTYLFNKSAKHNAILTGKANYIYGEGFENGDFKINRLGDSLNDLAKKAALDVEIYGGFRWEVIWNALGKVIEIYHVDFTSIRTGKKDGFYFKESWETKVYRENREEEEYIAAFDPLHPAGSQIYAYNEYRPMVRFYPLPSYIGCNNYIETDIEISKYYLSAIRNGMMPSKMVQFYDGDPGEEKKRALEHSFSKKFAGAENAGRFLLVFNKGKDKQLDISDLSHSEVDKMFVELNKTCQQEIYAGHNITSPALFGIAEPGKLGGNTELYTSYAIFQNTYSKPKASALSKEIKGILDYSNFQGEYDLLPSDPIGIQFDVKDVINSLPKAFVFTKLGIPEDQWDLENIGADNKPTPTVPIAPATNVGGVPGSPADAALSNDNIKNLTAKQHQQVLRIIRQYGKGQLTDVAAKTLLRAGLGLTDDDINSLLGIKAQPLAASFEAQEAEIIGMFDACGESKEDFEVLRSKRVSFSSDLEMESDEEIYIKEAFKTYDVTQTESRILELIRKDKLITAQVIADTIGQSEAYVISKLANLTQRGYIESHDTVDGIDTLVERTVVPSDTISIPPSTGAASPAQIFIKYSYEGPQDSKNRPFCAKMLQLRRLYSRAEIEQISARLGYSVFDRRGGFWTRKGTHDTTPYCRHNWKSNLIVKKANP